MRFRSVIAVSVAFLAGFGVLWVEDSRGASEHKFINVPGRTHNNPYSNAVLVGGTLYLASNIGIDPATGAPPPKIEDEVRLVMESMKTRLEDGGDVDGRPDDGGGPLLGSLALRAVERADRRCGCPTRRDGLAGRPRQAGDG